MAVVMEELVQWLRARLEEDGKVARAATDGPWSVDDESYAEAIYGADRVDVVAGGRWGGEASVFESTEDALHIVRHDPARVLADIEAKRLRVGAHARPHECIELSGSGERSVVDGQPWELWEPQHTEDTGPCFVLRTEALPYADHDDYKESWRP